MAYADQEMSGNKITAFIIVALLHLVLGYALVTGLAYSAAKKVIQKVSTIDIEEEVKKETPPPPPPKKANLPPPVVKIVVPKPPIDVHTSDPKLDTTPTPTPTPTRTQELQTSAAPRCQPKSPAPRGRGQGNWVTQNDYPSRAQSEEREGVTGYRLTVGADGRVASCSITNSSGSSDLDSTTCAKITSRARFDPGTNEDCQPSSGSFSGRVRWQLPKD